MALSASAQPPTPTQSPTPTPAKADKTADHAASADHTFVTKVAEGGMAEVKLGQLAADKATSEDVKKFGQRMVTDHSKANDELKALAQQKSITLPTDLNAKDKATYDRFSKLSGAEFDRAYMQHMLADHRTDVNEFKKESTSGKDPDVKAWAGKTLPTLEEHLKLAQDANKAVGTSGTKEKK
jgi:putative membrane protein